jgi:hypothetical protein
MTFFHSLKSAFPDDKIVLLETIISVLVIEAHVAEGYSFLEQHQKDNSVK